MSKYKGFLGFALVSGFGWTVDIGLYTILVKAMDIEPFYANIFSSFSGITFVWFLSLKTVFRSGNLSCYKYIFLYWLYQIFSIVFYSNLLIVILLFIDNSMVIFSLDQYYNILVKIIITPLNLLTNYLFMKKFTWWMFRYQTLNMRLEDEG